MSCFRAPRPCPKVWPLDRNVFFSNDPRVLGHSLGSLEVILTGTSEIVSDSVRKKLPAEPRQFVVVIDEAKW